MRRRPARADNATGFLIPGFPPGMNHQNDGRADQANRLPAFLIYIPVGTAEGQGIVKNQLRRGKTQAVLAPVDAVLFRIPGTARGIALM